ncbi:MAG: alpha/beta hydrolase [Clostridia bacterium]|nr:alpha/beta hydrolase [Clostridia bacterium]
MKIIKKVFVICMAVLLLAAGGFWFYCRVMNHRSFMAGFTDLFLTVQHRSDKFTYLDSCEAYIAEKAETNKEPVVIEKAKFGISLREERLEPLQAFIYNDQEHPAQTVFYFHGGAYINQPNTQQTTMAARTAKETGSEVVLMVYPKEPVYDCEEAYDRCLAYYRSYLENNDCGKIVFMGDSAGGGLALGLAEALRDQGDTCPEELILISPWVDVTLSNSDIKDYVDLDPMLGIDGLRRMGEVWANGLDMTDPRVSPIYGDLSGLGRVTLTTGTWEVLYPDSLLLAEKLKQAGVDCNLIIGERMIHCYPICPIPEAKAAQEVIWAAILR